MAAYKRRIFLINKPFQLRFSFYVCSWLFALSAVYPLILTSLFDQLIRYAALDPHGPALEQLKQGRQDVLWLLVFLQLSFLGITFLISIFTSHRIAGPLYKLDKFMREAASGHPQPKIQFRKNDHFENLAESYNAMMATLLSSKSSGTSPRQAQAIQQLEKLTASLSGAQRTEAETILQALRS
jgi:sensor histidine kinase YesM